MGVGVHVGTWPPAWSPRKLPEQRRVPGSWGSLPGGAMASSDEQGLPLRRGGFPTAGRGALQRPPSWLRPGHCHGAQASPAKTCPAARLSLPPSLSLPFVARASRWPMSLSVSMGTGHWWDQGWGRGLGPKKPGSVALG